MLSDAFKRGRQHLFCPIYCLLCPICAFRTSFIFFNLQRSITTFDRTSNFLLKQIFLSSLLRFLITINYSIMKKRIAFQPVFFFIRQYLYNVNPAEFTSSLSVILNIRRPLPLRIIPVNIFPRNIINHVKPGRS